jgi:sugar phosphate isomerase/epimerase
MKLATSTGDFSFYVDSVAEKVACLGPSPFRYINLEQPQTLSELYEEGDGGWKRLAERWAKAAEEAELTYVVSHAPCLHKPCLGLFRDPNDETYLCNLRAIRNSIHICNALGIKRIVVHACPDASFDKKQFYAYNERFYRDQLDLAEKYGITIMTENWDNNGTQFSTGREIRDFLDYMDHPYLAACWDTAHGNICKVAREIGQYDNILTIGDKLKGLHISDNFGDVHHHSWPFAGIINFDSVMQGLLDVAYDGYFTFEASYTLLHERNIPYHRKGWEYKGEEVKRLQSPSIALKQKAVELLYETGRHILSTYGCFEE